MDAVGVRCRAGFFGGGRATEGGQRRRDRWIPVGWSSLSRGVLTAFLCSAAAVANAASTDATLSALSLKDGEGATVAISPGFNAASVPASATLRKDTGYFVVFGSTASDAGNDYEIRGTESESLNSAVTGWQPIRPIDLAR
ncbi:MAG: hypothetical protein F4182_01280 [Gammaproteobacteria bacterium]|nr:hypothetical protein [Gammaproteobacteria bacterium]MYK38217.1 hypothetical protein [Gammaproteobacteria bacterium]